MMTSESMQLDLDQLRNCFAEAWEERDQLERSIERSLENIQSLQEKLHQWHTELNDDREELESERERLAREANQVNERQAAQSANVHRLEQELSDVRGALARQAATDEQSETRSLEQQNELRRLREECEKLTTQCNEAQQALEAERVTSQDLRIALETAHEGITGELEARLESINQELARTRGCLDQRNEAVHGLQQERTALETELEMVRARAAELTDALEKERKQMAEDRAEWSGELKQLRRLLERQARLSATPLANSHVQTTPAAASETQVHGGSKSPRRDDPVVGSVLAQFDRIRQQRIAARAAS
jgi:chromosome segregation ATPase